MAYVYSLSNSERRKAIEEAISKLGPRFNGFGAKLPGHLVEQLLLVEKHRACELAMCEQGLG